MSYEQYMKHSRNHRKDRFTQQCSLHFEPDAESPISPEQVVLLSKQSFARLLKEAHTKEFPVYVRQGYTGVWFFSTVGDAFTTELGSLSEMNEFYNNCI